MELENMVEGDFYEASCIFNRTDFGIKKRVFRFLSGMER